jgi:hypothetical protein
MLCYLFARGYRTVSLLSKTGADDAAVKTKLVDPYIAGWTDTQGTVHKATNPDIAEATLIVAAEDARVSRARMITTPASQPPPAAAPAAAQTRPSAYAVPTQLEPGQLQKMVDKWETATVPRRKFPLHLIEGADHTLARLHHEHTVSRQYTPLPLAEIIKARAYNSDGSVNIKVLQQHKESLFKIDGKHLTVEQTCPTFEYLEGDRWTLFDASEANAFAWKICGYGTDEAIDRLQVWLQKLVRDFSVSPKAFNYVYTSLSYRVAFALRAGTPLEDVITEVVADKEWLADQKTHAMPGASKPPQQQQQQQHQQQQQQQQRQQNQRRERSRSHGRDDNRDKRPRGRGKGKGTDDARGAAQGNQNRDRGAQQQRPQARGRSRSHGGTEICKKFNEGRCSRTAPGEKAIHGVTACKYSHECTACGRRCGRGAADCKNRR